ncbi:MAG: hypothetical protein IIC71_03430 [Acidobacteria bacterium]|nr:hypothetical protein [Acidobacteriota bacterium]
MEIDSDIVARLVTVNDELLALPDDAFAEKYKLLKERDKLREEASQYAVDLDAQRSDAGLLTELAALRSQLQGLEGQRIDLVTQAGGGGGGGGEMGNLGGVSLNARILEAGGASRIQGRIGTIVSVLADRGVEIPTTP